MITRRSGVYWRHDIFFSFLGRLRGRSRIVVQRPREEPKRFVGISSFRFLPPAEQTRFQTRRCCASRGCSKISRQRTKTALQPISCFLRRGRLSVYRSPAVPRPLIIVAADGNRNMVGYKSAERTSKGKTQETIDAVKFHCSLAVQMGGGEREIIKNYCALSLRWLSSYNRF